MRVAMYYANADVRLVELPVPAIGANEALLRIQASGICGSDVMEWYRRDKVPLVLGHEVAGVVEAVGKGLKKFKPGDRIVVTHHVPCEECEYCRNGHETVCETLRKTHFDPGGFCEFVRLPQINLKKGTLKIPKKVSFEEATFVEPLGCVLRGQRLAGMGKRLLSGEKGKRVLVIGSGMAGLLHVKAAKYFKARSIIATDLDTFRLDMAKKAGATAVISASDDVPKKVREHNQGRLADLVVICAGAQSAIEQGLRSVERGGTVLIFTAAPKDSCLPVATNEIFWRSEVTVLSSYAAAPVDLKQALDLIAARKIPVRDIITHRLPLSKIQQGFDLVVRPDRSLKVIIEPWR